MTLASTRRACGTCHIEMHPHQNAVYLLEMADFGPYKLWPADIWACPECECKIITGLPTFPMAEHYQSNFNSLVTMLREQGETIIEIR